MKLKSIVLVLLLCPLLLVGCGSSRPPKNPSTVATISNPDIFPSVFKYSEIQDKTLEAAESGDMETAPFFVQNYIRNIYLKSGTRDRELVLREVQVNSVRHISMLEDALQSHGYQKVAPEYANCVISIYYGEGNKDGRVLDLDDSSPFAVSVSKAKPRTVVESSSESSATGEVVTGQTTYSRGGKIVTPRPRKQVFKLGFLKIFCDLPTDEGEARRAWEITAMKKQKKNFESGFELLVDGASRELPEIPEENSITVAPKTEVVKLQDR